MIVKRKRRLTAEEYADGILKGDRIILSRAITLAESNLPADNELATQVLEKVLPATGKAVRIGITGVPGVGKSTFIEGFGKYITGIGKKLAVLAIDPTSQRSGGSILGDKTRMEELSQDRLAYIRPSAAGSALGGVAAKTREAMLLCEAAGFEVIIIETVGVGQSETAVRNMVDFFLLLMLAGAGDELQGIKKGIMEMADALAITKADGDNKPKAQRAKAEYQNALHLFPPQESGWIPQVLTCSALLKEGLNDIWDITEQYIRHTTAKGYFQKNRRDQNLSWMFNAVDYLLKNEFYSNAAVKTALDGLRQDVLEGKTAATRAARELFKTFQQNQ